MPYEGEYAAYRSIRRIVEAERVKRLLNRDRSLSAMTNTSNWSPIPAPPSADCLPGFVLAIDGSYAEVDVKTGYPGAKVGYVTVASVLLDLDRINVLDECRPVDPADFRKTEQADTIDAAIPGSNVVTLNQASARASFRQELYEVFHDVVLDDVHRVRLLTTYEELLHHKPVTRSQECPYRESHGCQGDVVVPPGTSKCPKCNRPIFSTDALRIHERFRDIGTNGEAFGLVMQVWERILLVHILRCFERLDLLGRLERLAFFLDGPLGVFGPPAWLSATISVELKRLNRIVRESTGCDLNVIGVEKTGNFVNHFDEIDHTESPGKSAFDPRTYLLLTDKYIKQRITCSDSDKRYGLDTYFGRKFFYKTHGGARIVGTLPFLTDKQDTLSTDDISLYPSLPTLFSLLDKLASSRYVNAVTPLIAAHSHAAIPLQLGAKVLKSLASALMEHR